MSVLDEIREAYAAVGIAVDQPITYGTYYRLRCGRCNRAVGNVGDRLLPGMAADLVQRNADLYAAGGLGCTCVEQKTTSDAPGSGRVAQWPFWRAVYAQGDPLPRLQCTVSRPTHRFDEDEPLPAEYRELLLKMLRHEGERAGNKSFLGFMGTCLELAETLYPTQEARLLKAEYLAEELKHAIMFHRVAVGLEPDFALRDVPYAHYTFHLPRESWADDAFFHFFVDWNQYLAPIVTRTLPISGETFMLAVGVIEIAAGFLVAIAPRIGGYVVAMWLWGIIANLLMAGGYYDIALRDFGLSLGALALAVVVVRALALRGPARGG